MTGRSVYLLVKEKTLKEELGCTLDTKTKVTHAIEEAATNSKGKEKASAVPAGSVQQPAPAHSTTVTRPPSDFGGRSHRRWVLGPLPRLRQFAVPVSNATLLFKVPVDPFIVRPQDLLRRGFDELALALHLFVMGTMILNQKRSPIKFIISKELTVRTDSTVFKLPVIERDIKKTYEIFFNNQDAWSSDKELDKTSTRRSSDWQRLCQYAASLHSHEAGYLLLHVWQLNNKHTHEPFYTTSAKPLASALYLFCKYLTHRSFLADGEEHVWKVAAIGDKIFELMLKLLEDGINVNSLSKKRADLYNAINAHRNTISGIARTFRYLKHVFYSPSSRLDDEGMVLDKLRRVLASIDDNKEYEHFAVVNLASRFAFNSRAMNSADQGESESSNKEGEEEKGKENNEKELGDIEEEMMQTTKGSRVFFKPTIVYRFKFKPQLSATLRKESFTLLDVLSVTHVDIFNRGFDYLTLAIKQLLISGYKKVKEDKQPRITAVALFARLLAASPLQQSLSPWGGKLTNWLEGISEHVDLWASSSATPTAWEEDIAGNDTGTRNTSLLDHYEGYKKQCKYAKSFLQSSPFVNDTRYILGFLRRAITPETRWGPISETFEKLWDQFLDHIQYFPRLKQLREQLDQLISFRDCLGHQSNLQHAERLEVDTVSEVIDTLRTVQQAVVDLLLSPLDKDEEEACDAVEREIEPWLQLLPELYELLASTPPEKYRSFRHRQYQCGTALGQPDRWEKLKENAKITCQLLIEEMEALREATERDSEKEKEKEKEGDKDKEKEDARRALFTVLQCHTSLLPNAAVGHPRLQEGNAAMPSFAGATMWDAFEREDAEADKAD